MTLTEYIEKSKKELDKMAEEYMKHKDTDPEHWPLDMPEGEWADQELFTRF